MGYDLKKDAVDRLVNADKKKYEDAPKDPGKQYRSDIFDRIPKWILALVMKWWFAGAVCFFVYWGLSSFLGPSTPEMIVVLAIALGIVTDILVNNAFRFFETYPGQNSKWMMFPKKAYWTFLANMPYALLVLTVVMNIYDVINKALLFIMNAGPDAKQPFGVEPVVFGLFYVGVDMAFIGIKRLMINIINDAKQKNGM